MVNQILKGMLIALLMSSAACNAKKDEPLVTPVDKEQIKRMIQDKETQYAETYNSGELKNIEYYADDATVYAQNKPPLVGKEAIIAYLKAGLEASSKGNWISCTTEEVFVSNDANQVVEVGYFRLVDSLDAVINTGHYMVLFEKRDGKYVSVREMSTSDIPIEYEE